MIGRILGGIWLALDGVRKFLHLVLLLAIFGFIVGALKTSIPRIADNSALVIAPRGDIVEQLTGSPVDQAIAKVQGDTKAETLVWDLIDALRAAKKDARIKAVVLDLDQMSGGGQPTLAEFAAAIDDFRASKKKVVAHASALLQEQYFVAAHADEIYIDPLGLVGIDGYERYRTYYKELFDKLGVTVNLFRVGMYKSAAEVYVRKDMSPEDKEESLAYLNALWSSYQASVAAPRKLKPEDISNYVANSVPALLAAKGDAAKVALDAKLITGIKSSLEVERRMVELVGRNDDPKASNEQVEKDADSESFNATYYEDYLRVVEAEKKARAGGKDKIGVIVASGEILDGNQPPGTVGGESTALLIRDARLDDDVKAIVLRVDSPGGSVLASEQIYREVRAAQKVGKPVVVSMGDLAASGGYYIASSADEIWAHPATITGSIGIFGAIPTFEGTLAKIGVSVDGVGTTNLSGQLRVDRPMGEDAKKLLQSMIERGYEEFLGHVAEGRRKTRDEVHAIAQGRVWIGSDAQKNGLVDKLGLFDDAVKSAAARAKLKDYEIERIEPELTFAEQLALQIRIWFATTFYGDLAKQVPFARVSRELEPMQREIERWQRLDSRDHRFAYCFCDVR
ncbi:MAG TPA: signal peptide peptidase SppA [Steroidobacteraceae bacterium]|nr:signal peptide peptidase SppA [Steroidobacteraceae bacterium]